MAADIPVRSCGCRIDSTHRIECLTFTPCGPDIAVDDRAAFLDHQWGRSTTSLHRGWLVSAETLRGVAQVGADGRPRMYPLSPPTFDSLPMYSDETVPFGFVRPVTIGVPG